MLLGDPSKEMLVETIAEHPHPNQKEVKKRKKKSVPLCLE